MKHLEGCVIFREESRAQLGLSFDICSSFLWVLSVCGWSRGIYKQGAPLTVLSELVELEDACFGKVGHVGSNPLCWELLPEAFWVGGRITEASQRRPWQKGASSVLVDINASQLTRS